MRPRGGNELTDAQDLSCMNGFHDLGELGAYLSAGNTHDHDEFGMGIHLVKGAQVIQSLWRGGKGL